MNETIRQGLQGARLMEDYWNDRITASELVAAIQPQYRRGLEGALQVQAWEAAANDSQKFSGLNGIYEFTAKIRAKKEGLAEALTRA